MTPSMAAIVQRASDILLRPVKAGYWRAPAMNGQSAPRLLATRFNTGVRFLTFDFIFCILFNVIFEIKTKTTSHVEDVLDPITKPMVS